LDNWQNFETKKRREIVISERKQQFSLEGMTGSFPIKEKESDEEDFNYTRNNRGYEEKKKITLQVTLQEVILLEV
jgi:hypothetical protein